MNRMSNTTPSPAGMPGPADIREFETGPPGRRTRRAGPLAHGCPFRAAGATGRETAAASA